MSVNQMDNGGTVMFPFLQIYPQWPDKGLSVPKSSIKAWRSFRWSNPSASNSLAMTPWSSLEPALYPSFFNNPHN